MPTKKLGLEIDTRLYSRLTQMAKANGQSKRFLLEQALKHYLEIVAPSRGTIRPEALANFRQSVEKNRKLMELLAK